MIAAQLVGRLHLEWIAAGVGFGETECQNLLARGRGPQITLFLVIIAPGENRILSDGSMTRKESPHRRAFATNASDGSNISQRIRATSTQCIRKNHSQEAILATERQHLIVELMFDIA